MAGWWVRLLVTGMFAFYLNYVPIHLATTRHQDGFMELAASALSHHDGHDDVDHHDDDHHHTPHPASDHRLTLTAQTQSPVFVLTVAWILTDTSILIELQQQQQLVPVFEHIWPPGDSPPDPRQPRAPPLA